MSLALEHVLRLKTIHGARIIASRAAARIVASQHFNNAWTPRADLAAIANRIRNMFPLPDRIRRRGFKVAILIRPYAFPNSSGNLAMFARILRAYQYCV